MALEQRFSMQPVSRAPWPRYAVDREVWERITDDLAAGTYTLLGLWAERDCVHMAVFDPSACAIAIATLPVLEGRYPSVARKHLPALRMERFIADLFGLTAENCPDTRPWIDHGKWPARFPLASATVPDTSDGIAYTFLPVQGEGIHQISVGPIHAGIIEPGHFRFSANGETIVRLEERLGYAHKGIEKLFIGADLTAAAKLAGRISGDSTVAYTFAFARAAETALNIGVPPRAQWVRALMAELERIANHAGDIGAICNDASFTLLHAYFGILREEALQLAHACFGHRLMMDCVVPGGVAIDMDDRAKKRIKIWVDSAEKRFSELIKIYDNTSSLKDRTDTTGVVREELARLYGAGGYVGRASGRNFDARKHTPYPPYDVLKFDVTLLNRGDINARIWARYYEVQQSFLLIRQILEQLPQGNVMAAPPCTAGTGGREGMALVEGFRGDILIWLRFGENGKIERCHPRDPSWFQWPLLEAAIEGNIVADFPLCNKSFNCSYSGHDV